MTRIRFNQAWSYALSKLQTELLPALEYHSFHHTLNEVIFTVNRLAHLEQVTSHSRLLLITAACFHDLGFTAINEETPEEYAKRLNHENDAADHVALVLPAYGFPQDDIATVQRLIMATQLPASPNDLLEGIMCDADLSSLGLPTDEFVQTSLTLRAELGRFGMFFSDHQWWQRQIDFLTQHTYYTPSAQKLFSEQKTRNLLKLYHLLEESVS